ncbi:uncharacterized protein KY384_006339 [Bacidia gigantensis]|uniref:uncharacterized protein n=1 Tax=Bacidia gigantensis TaxID=2732470 RepID=UPI001D048617|nr:uncharacterized protein KY384_006339 [Bacidia gigantensis]KAG8528652.1 hypothetical protein KY384_006339 [Bacidia gigantensis]
MLNLQSQPLLLLLLGLLAVFTEAQNNASTNSSGLQDPTVPEQIIVAQTNLGMEVTCPRHESDLIPIADCSRAMLKFPQNLDTHIFSPGDPAGSPRDIYKLPSERSYGECLMRVDLVSVQQDLSSWLAVGTVALQLTMACANQRQQWGFGKTGGTTTTGEGGRSRLRFRSLDLR